MFGGLLAAAILVFLFVLVVAFAAPATVGLALGRLLVRGEGRSFLAGLGALALGLLVVVLVAAIPLVGGFLEALLVLLGLGALLLMAIPSRRRLLQPVAEPRRPRARTASTGKLPDSGSMTTPFDYDADPERARCPR